MARLSLVLWQMAQVQCDSMTRTGVQCSRLRRAENEELLPCAGALSGKGCHMLEERKQPQSFAATTMDGRNAPVPHQETLPALLRVYPVLPKPQCPPHGCCRPCVTTQLACAVASMPCGALAASGLGKHRRWLRGWALPAAASTATAQSTQPNLAPPAGLVGVLGQALLVPQDVRLCHHRLPVPASPRGAEPQL